MIRKFLREPMLHFFALAALLFVLEAWFSAGQKTRIVIDQAAADYLIRQREDLELRVLDEAERTEVIQAYVEDEILYREAYKRGLDQGDSRLRRNLILKMRGLITGDLESPGEDELRSYFEANRDRFTRPARYELEQVSFDPAAEIPAEIEELLEAGGIEARRLPGMTRSLIAGTFGAEAGREILAIADDAWHGPFATPGGVHFVRLIDYTPERAAEYEAVRSYLTGDWMMDQSRALIREEVARVSGEYEVVIEAEL
jgi:hypothetical protein